MAAPKKEISLLPTENGRLEKLLKWALNFGRWIVVTTELIVILCFLSRFKLDRDLTDLGERIKQQQAIIVSFGGLEKNFRNLQARLAFIDKLGKNQFIFVGILNKIAKITPIDLSLDKLTVKGGKIELSGASLSEAGFGNFIKGLSEIGLRGITLDKVSKKGAGGIEFKLSAGLNR